MNRFAVVVILVGAILAVPQAAPILAQNQTAPAPQASPHFTDVTEACGVKFRYLSSHTTKKYLPETMGAGVALFDFDNDGRLDAVLTTNDGPSEFSTMTHQARTTGWV